MSESLRVGLVQMRSGVDPAANLEAASAAVRDAAARGAELILTPEATNLLQRDEAALIATVRSQEDDPAPAAFCELARELGVWLIAGSLMLKKDAERAVNRSFVFDPSGAVAATYDKIHLFDVQLGSGETYRESKRIAPGGRAVVVDAPWTRLGLTICYDLRFPRLYRALAKAGAGLITVPAAFTRPTGEAHWETLLRARAIETGAFVLAPAQGGRHEDGRATWGRSTVVGPWGEVIAKLDHDEPGVLIADLNLAQITEAREKIPSLTHDRDFEGP
ncbi:MAG: carbon-nitrogen hydrolase family protein [Maricaulaceae bacterium]|jgi:predicted amidohydrolase